MKRFVISEETEDSVGMELVEDTSDADLIALRDIDEIDDDPTEYYFYKKDISKLIEGLKYFMESE